MKVEIVARALTAMELKFDIIESAETQREKLKKTYSELLKGLDIPDQERTDDITSWPLINMGNIFSYILRKKVLDVDYIHRQV